MLPDDLRALTPLIYAHVTPYGTFGLDSFAYDYLRVAMEASCEVAFPAG